MDLNEKMDQLTRETSELRKEVAHLKESLTKQNQIIVRLIKEQCNLIKKSDEKRDAQFVAETSVRPHIGIFPIKSQEDLDAAEESIKEENKEECIAVAKALLMPGSFKKNIGKIFGIDVILDYNVDGRHNKKRIQDYSRLMDVLFQATKREGWHHKYFLDELRSGFKCAKNKHFKFNWTQRKKYSEQQPIEPSVKIEEVLIPYDDEDDE
ncbi:uncharacterized protein LOC101452604 [Ceratitis capitata]|uniref:(Mediterranean fruit fly) hypothetical protein n=2 Tax=Ceratitis capitata TaxID=7213 RepID=W8BAF2_CERCA|nr:uncharacterized protein LOC101452604 [Ceratitis capitata]XP_012159046.1 uncharacterized protein LOC101452604 [Ceratitis capitata]XP_020715629.1 uncharacterized protein LOC101452604 [Ceratitis capitata]XP_020715630.1 uncharacterized protein LOC101452604 [Ceratitis capitata]XP_020715631.1 uncharacterized protein LOC101452604 [Ceratitis capitata]CAD6993364.1 unnamed protein product [Ceratitis capitata]